jgi:sugar lactone lactonase YvrE
MRPVVLALALALGSAPAVAAQGDSTWRDHDRAADKAYRAGDFATFRAQLLTMRREIGPLPFIDYDLAVAEARLGNRDRALEWLETFAGMGVWEDVARDSDLASIRSLGGYPRVVTLLSANLEPVTRGAVAFTLADADLVAEDIAYDSVRRRFLLSSVRRRKIIAVDSAGHATDFTQPGADSTWGLFAVHVDPARQLLWATTAAVNTAQGYTAVDSGRSALLEYDLATGALRARLEPPDVRRAHVLGDMTIGADGTVYVSDAVSGAVYTAAPGARMLAVLVPTGTFSSPQTPALSADEKRLFVADYARGIAVVDLSSKRVSWLGHPGNVALVGTDGLYRVGNTLLAVQNGTTPNRVLRLLLDTAMTRVLDAEVLERAKPAVSDPTHGVMVGDTFYFIARSGWDRVRDNGTLAPGGADDASVVRRLVLVAAP